MNQSSLRVAMSLTEAAKAIHAPLSMEESLDAIVEAALGTVPGFDHVGISVSHRDGKMETMAGTDQLVWELDDLQYRLGRGPCVDAMEGEEVVVVPRARYEQRWPAYIPEAVRRGLRAQLGIRLYTDKDGTLGGLNLYSTQNEQVDQDAVEIAQMFATHAAIALGRSRQEHGLNEALATRQVIGQAMGIIMERYRIDRDQAFHFLVRASRASDLKMRDVAQELVDTTEERHKPTST